MEILRQAVDHSSAYFCVYLRDLKYNLRELLRFDFPLRAVDLSSAYFCVFLRDLKYNLRDKAYFCVI